MLVPVPKRPTSLPGNSRYRGHDGQIRFDCSRAINWFVRDHSKSLSKSLICDARDVCDMFGLSSVAQEQGHVEEKL